MKVQIEGNLYLESDNMQFMLREYTGAVSVDKKTGKESEVYNTLGYFTNIQSALVRLLRMKLMDSTVNNLDALLIDLKRIEYDIKKTWSVELKDGERVAI